MVNNNSGSKYATMAETMKQKVSILDQGIDDRIREKEIKSEITRIDDELKQLINEIKATPIDTELIKKQAEANLESTKKSNKRMMISNIERYENIVKEKENELTKAKRELETVKETSKEEFDVSNLEAEQQYEKTISSIGNTEETLKLKIDKVKLDAERAKKQLNSELNSLIAKREAHQEKVQCIDELYKDLKEISLRIGDVK